MDQTLDSPTYLHTSLLRQSYSFHSPIKHNFQHDTIHAATDKGAGVL